MTKFKNLMPLKAVIPAAGLGTRLLPVTKEQPKEMLPIFERAKDGSLIVKPFLQVVFEKIYGSGVRDFCFVVGRGKRSIEDHFTLDNHFLYQLASSDKLKPLNELSRFYSRVKSSNIVFVNQPEPRGFGDSVLRSRSFVGKDPFIVHAGDDLILSERNGYIRRLVATFQTNHADAVFFVQKIPSPQMYGVIEGKKVDKNLYRVTGIQEKPRIPASNLAIIAIYAFSSKIFKAITDTAPQGSEIQLTDAILGLINQGESVFALELEEGERRIDIGTPESYWYVLNTMQEYFASSRKSRLISNIKTECEISASNHIF